ncbi:HAMP domain-containing sensor histidine kinase [Mucilaginibacter sp. KACC 22773]|uniref:sensor histidine kinase n=1 Tax=Mucilaginibacter sp. KACC 22773 TaxID=3025671 RepID=UPI0023665A99|nr:HAMP domain-containing sensor histidine kinase [Mucilaginibacter sp. KACC 22773]WDF78178.1 HAMP domain-containing sensor histidine kinase [Mucilaginibacter sp. KACC 22773]
MKLRTKLTLFNAISKLVIVILFVLLVPVLIKNISSSYVDSKLIKQKNKLLQIVKSQGIETYIVNGEGYGSYLPLKDEYISLDEVDPKYFLDTIQRGKRLFSEGDTLEYRILSHTFKVKNKNYLLEIGKSVDTLDETSIPLQNLAFQVLLGMILLTVLADQVYSNYVLKPLRIIIKTKLVGQRFPNFQSYRKVRTTTSDFEHLDLSIHNMIETIADKFHKEREFISNASHELMTPISILQSKIENMFEEEDINDELKVRLLEMQKILNRLKSITKTLLLISQIENEQFLKEDKVSVSELLQDVYDEISIRLQDKNISYEVSVPDNWYMVNINKFLLFNLFFNLINNAIKYNREDGSIRVAAVAVHDKFIISITDTGIGIDAEALPLIFNRFKKFRQSLQQDSFGLGLPIVKSIAGFHNIEVDVVSEKDVGSTFKLIFPATLIIVS